MKWIIYSLFLIVLILSPPHLFAQDDQADTRTYLEQQLDYYSNMRVELEVMLKDTDTFILIPRLRQGYSAQACSSLRFTISREEVRQKIGEAVLDYCLEFDVKPDSQKAIEFGDALYSQLKLIDQENRVSLRKLYERTRADEDEYREKLLIHQRDHSSSEKADADYHTNVSLAGVWRYSSGNEIRFTQTASNRWEGYYVKVASDVHIAQGWRPGDLVYRNIHFDKSRSVYTSEFYNRTADPNNHHWEQRDFQVAGNTISGISYGEAAEKISE